MSRRIFAGVHLEGKGDWGGAAPWRCSCGPAAALAQRRRTCRQQQHGFGHVKQHQSFHLRGAQGVRWGPWHGFHAWSKRCCIGTCREVDIAVLSGCIVARGHGKCARPANVFGVVVAQQLRHPHIRHLGGAPVLGQQHVGSLDVAVDDLRQGDETLGGDKRLCTRHVHLTRATPAWRRLNAVRRANPRQRFVAGAADLRPGFIW